MAKGKIVFAPHAALIRDAFFQRYGWTFRAYLEAPEWLLEEQMNVIAGEAEGAKAASADNGGPSYGAEMRSAADLASSGGLPMPGGGWPQGEG